MGQSLTFILFSDAEQDSETGEEKRYIRLTGNRSSVFAVVESLPFGVVGTVHLDDGEGAKARLDDEGRRIEFTAGVIEFMLMLLVLLRTRTDEAHLPDEDIEKLRQFIQRGLS